jgi:CBS domain-containing protein
MTRNARTVSQSVTLRELGRLFEKDDFNAYPVEEGARIVGLVSKFDFLACFVFTLAYMIPRYDDLMNRTVSEIMTPEFIYVREETKLTRVLQLMVDHRIRSMPVIEGDQRLVGIISRDDVMRALQCCTSEKAWLFRRLGGYARALHPRDPQRNQPAFSGRSSSGEFRYIPDIVSTQHRWS